MNTVAQKTQVRAASFLRHIPSDHVVQTQCVENFDLKVSNTSHNLIDLLTGLLREPCFVLWRIGHGAVREDTVCRSPRGHSLEVPAQTVVRKGLCVV